MRDVQPERVDVVTARLLATMVDDAAFVDRLTAGRSENSASDDRVIRVDWGDETLTEPSDAIEGEIELNHYAVNR